MHTKIEELHIAYLDKNRRVRCVTRNTGDAGAVEMDPAQALRIALWLGTKSLIVAHNHPSGDPEPSRADHAATRRLCDAAKLLNLRIHDHIVIAGNRHWSFRAAGLM